MLFRSRCPLNVLLPLVTLATLIFVHNINTLRVKRELEFEDKSQQIAGFFSLITSDNKDKRIPLLYSHL